MLYLFIMNLILGYDIVTYNGELPNCLDPKFLPTVYEGGKFDFSKIRTIFNERYKCDSCVFNDGTFDNLSEKKSLHEILKDKKNGLRYKWFYLIEPHSGLDLFFGLHKIHNTFAMEFMSEIAINEIVNGDGNLLIHYTVDGGLGVNLENFQKIIDFTRNHHIPDEKVYFIFSDFKLKDNFNKFNVNYKVFDFNFYLIFKSQEFNNIIKKRPFIELNKSSIVMPEDFINSIGSNKKDFLLLTRIAKLHRYMLLFQMYNLGLDNNLISWDKNFFRGDLIEKMRKYVENDDFANLLETTSKYVDVKDIANVSGYGFENKEIYLNTYISIVTESIFFQSESDPDKLSDFPTGFLSEKIWKPIGHCQPFILVGPSKSLKYIKEELRFKTFHPYINESYDNENNDLKRLELIQIEIEKFSKKTKEEKDQFLNDVKEICIYNHKQFLKYGDDEYILTKKSMYFNMIDFLIGNTRNKFI
jgi:hypothetical protein